MTAAPTTRTVLVANPSADLYGSDRMMLEAVHGLVRFGWRTVVTCSTDGPLTGLLADAGAEVRIQPAPVVRKSMLNPIGLVSLVRDIAVRLPQMRRLVREVRPDVILANTLTIPFWSVVARLVRRPVVVYVHEAEAALSKPARALLTAPLALADGVIFNSETSRSVSGLTRLEKRRRTRVVLNGVRGPAAADPSRSLLDPPFRIVYVGRISPRKGVDLVIEAVRLLSARHVDATVDLVGAVFPGYEWYEAQLRDQVTRSGLSDAVRFVGFQESVWNFLSEADVAVVPSRADESFGNVVIEAALAARPVVVADQTGLREATNGLEAAVLVSSDDARALAEALLRVHDEWARFREAASRDAAYAKERYSAEHFQERLAGVLTEFVPAP